MKDRIAKAHEILDARAKTNQEAKGCICPGQIQRMKNLLEYVEGKREDF